MMPSEYNLEKREIALDELEFIIIYLLKFLFNQDLHTLLEKLIEATFIGKINSWKNV